MTTNKTNVQAEVNDVNTTANITTGHDSDCITEEEFDALLDERESKKASVQTTKTVEDNSEFITEDEFDALLDELDREKAAEKVAMEPAVKAEAIIDEDVEVANDAPQDTTENNNNKGENIVIQLEGKLEIAELSSVYKEIIPPPEVESDITFDLSKITSIDTAALQMLFAYVRDARSQGCAIIWDKPSEILLERAKQLNLSDHLGLGVSNRIS